MYYKSDYKITRVINYIRKSRRDEERERRTGEDSLEEQRILMTRVLNDMEVAYDQKFEIGSGDKIETRPVFQEVLNELRQGKYDAIAVKEISRLGRGSYTDMGIVYDLLQEKRIYIITPWKIYDPTNPSDLRQIRFELFFAREEFETIRERLVGSRYNYAMEGKWMTGIPPYGYQINKQTQRLEPHPEESKIVQLIFDLYVNGINGKDVGFRAIATYLTTIGIKTPRGKKLWYARQIERIIENPVYIGQVRFRTTERRNGKVIKRPDDEHIIVNNAHESLVSELIWYEAQKKRNSTRKLPSIQISVKASELTSLIICKECGWKATVNRYMRKRKNDEYEDVYLKCRGGGCFTVKYDVVLDKVEKTLEFFKDIDENTLQKHLEQMLKLQQNVESRDHHIEEIRKSIERKKKELETKRNAIFDNYESGFYTKEVFLERMEIVKKELEKLEQVEKELESGSAQSAPTIDTSKFKMNITSVLEYYHSLDDPEDKNKLLREIFHYIEIKILEKGTKKKEPKLELTPIFRVGFIKDGLQS